MGMTAAWLPLLAAIVLAVIVFAVVVDHTPALAAIDAVDVTRFTVDGGGGSSQAGDFALIGTAGQADAGVVSGGDFVLVGGFWGGYPPQEEGEGKVYVPILSR
jgi:hypothetical protein